MNKKQFIPVNEPLLDGNEKKYLIECIDTGWISSEGPFVKRFEDNFAQRMSRKHAVAVVNGTAAIDANALAPAPLNEFQRSSIIPTSLCFAGDATRPLPCIFGDTDEPGLGAG
jgi:dTDP-4-amino-4,6-dideoxygalactose transaminase